MTASVTLARSAVTGSGCDGLVYDGYLVIPVIAITTIIVIVITVIATTLSVTTYPFITLVPIIIAPVLLLALILILPALFSLVDDCDEVVLFATIIATTPISHLLLPEIIVLLYSTTPIMVPLVAPFK